MEKARHEAREEHRRRQQRERHRYFDDFDCGFEAGVEWAREQPMSVVDPERMYRAGWIEGFVQPMLRGQWDRSTAEEIAQDQWGIAGVKAFTRFWMRTEKGSATSAKLAAESGEGVGDG